MIMQHIFTNENGARTINISGGLVRLQPVLEELSRFHETRGMDEKGLIYCPLHGEDLFLIGQASRYPVKGRPAYIQHNYVFDSESFLMSMQQADRMLRGSFFYTNPADVPSPLPEITVLQMDQVNSYTLPELNWDNMTEILFSGYLSNWRFRKKFDEFETVARMILARVLSVMPLELLKYLPGVHTSSFSQLSDRIAIRFPYYEELSSICFVDDTSNTRNFPYIIKYFASRLRANMPVILPTQLSVLLCDYPNVFNSLSLIKDVLAFYISDTESNFKEMTLAYISLIKSPNLTDFAQLFTNHFQSVLDTAKNQSIIQNVLNMLRRTLPEFSEHFARHWNNEPAPAPAPTPTPVTMYETIPPSASVTANGKNNFYSMPTEQIEVIIEHDMIFVKDQNTLNQLVSLYITKFKWESTIVHNLTYGKLQELVNRTLIPHTAKPYYHESFEKAASLDTEKIAISDLPKTEDHNSESAAEEKPRVPSIPQRPLEKKSRATKIIISCGTAAVLLTIIAIISMFDLKEALSGFIGSLSDIYTTISPDETFITTEPPTTAIEPPTTESASPDTASDLTSTGSEPANTATEPPSIGSEPANIAADPPSTGSEPANTATEPLSIGSEPANTAADPLSMGSEPSITASIIPHTQPPVTPQISETAPTPEDEIIQPIVTMLP
ncbi:MAG: hypothetical protein LBQ68_04175 [Clostridiales bacterium]|jgi:hypothetical protein|nr:hypothetical protein [Clostridiales bacterium]